LTSQAALDVYRDAHRMTHIDIKGID